MVGCVCKTETGISFLKQSRQSERGKVLNIRRGGKGYARRGTTKGLWTSGGRALLGISLLPSLAVALMESLVGLARLPFQASYSLYSPYLCFFRTTASVDSYANAGSIDLIYSAVSRGAVNYSYNPIYCLVLSARYCDWLSGPEYAHRLRFSTDTVPVSSMAVSGRTRVMHRHHI